MPALVLVSGILIGLCLILDFDLELVSGLVLDLVLGAVRFVLLVLLLVFL